MQQARAFCRARVGRPATALVAMFVVAVWTMPALTLPAGAQPAAVQPAPPQPAARTQGLDAPDWKVYADQAGTRVDYPAGIFIRDAGGVPRGEGRELRSADDRARLMVYVEPNRDGLTPSRFIRTQLSAQKSALEYRRITDRFFAISGVVGDQIYYSRCNFPAGARGPIHCIYIAYPRAEEPMWDAIVTRISRSLRPAR